MARQSGSNERSSRGFGTTPGGRAFVWLLTLTSIVVVLAVWFSFRGANEAPQDLPAEAGAASSPPSAPESDAAVIQPAVVLPALPDEFVPGGDSPDDR